MDKQRKLVREVKNAHRASAKMDKLLDPGKCSHPSNRRHYNGIQKDKDGKPVLSLYTCMDCGTTKALKILGEI